MLDKTTMAVACLLVAGCITQVNGGSEDAASAQLAAVQLGLSAPASPNTPDQCDQEFRFEHSIDVGDGVHIHVIEVLGTLLAAPAPARALDAAGDARGEPLL